MSALRLTEAAHVVSFSLPSASFTTLQHVRMRCRVPRPSGRIGRQMKARQQMAFDALAIAACIVALTIALGQVRGLEWPYDGDHYRDVAQAQTARNGHPLSDPHYPGEWVWYNPLVPWIVAAGSAITRATPLVFHVQSGPWLNLLAPVSFYVLGVTIAGKGAALAGLIIFLFFNCRNDPALTCPTYSSWLFVATFAQGLFFTTLLVMTRSAARPSDAKAAAVGVLAGLTFLAHTGPALVLGGIALLTMRWRALLVSGLVALLVASPFLYGIAWHYRLAVLNPVPMVWPWPPVTLHGFPGTLRANVALIVAALIGAIVVTHKMARLWLIVSLVFTVYGLSRDALPWLPPVVPTFHFWRYSMAAFTLLAGAAAWKVCELSARRYAVPMAAAIVVAAVAYALPQYRSRFDFTYGRSISETRDPTHARVTKFLQTSIPETAVVLGSRGASLQIIGPAGRKVVAVNASWSNPYVENAARVRDREAMLEALKAHDTRRFTDLADAYHVTHVVGVGAAECAEMIDPPRVQLLYRSGDLCVFRRLTAGEE